MKVFSRAQFLLLLPYAAHAVRTILAGAEKECLGVRAVPKAEVVVDYEVLPNENQVKLEITRMQLGPQNTTLTQPATLKTLHATHSGSLNLTSHLFPAQETRFTACFTNLARNSPIELIFSIRADVYEHLYDVATLRHTEGLKSAVVSLSSAMKETLKQQEFAIAREDSHRLGTVYVSVDSFLDVHDSRDCLTAQKRMHCSFANDESENLELDVVASCIHYAGQWWTNSAYQTDVPGDQDTAVAYVARDSIQMATLTHICFLTPAKHSGAGRLTNDTTMLQIFVYKNERMLGT